MAKVTSLKDDIDGTIADDVTTRAFVDSNGDTYEIDLTNDNYTKLRDIIETAIAPYKNVATKRKTVKRVDKTEIREWAKAKGMTVSEKGRISKEIQDAYDAEHSND